MSTASEQSRAEHNASEELTTTQQVARMLSEELQSDQARAIWGEYLPKTMSADTPVISYRAVARALSNVDSARYGTESMPNRYKDRVRRALLGQKITLETLNLFAECFNISEESHQEMAGLLSQEMEATVVSSSNTTNLRYSITTSFYDIFLNDQLKPRRITCTLILRSLQPELDGVWAPQSPDIEDIELLRGGNYTFDTNRKMWHFLFDYPLAEMESTELVYQITVNPEAEQVGLASLRFYLARENCFFRLNFDSAENAPDKLKVTRHPESEEDSYKDRAFELNVHDQKASFHLPQVENERIIFDTFSKSE